MDKDQLIRFLCRENVISGSTAGQIADQFSYKQIDKNQFQLEAGKICDDYLFLEKGIMRSFATGTEGQEVTTAFSMPGEMVFEVSSFFQRHRSRENIQAITDCVGFCISYRQLNDLFHSLPEFREFGRSILVRGFSGLKTRMLTQITETAEERYAGLIASSPEIFKHATLKSIASYMGITDTSLSRIRKEFGKK